MLDIMTMMLLEDWENEDAEIIAAADSGTEAFDNEEAEIIDTADPETEVFVENSDMVENIITDWEESILIAPENTSSLIVNGQLLAQAPGFALMPDHGISYENMMSYKDDFGFTDLTREELGQKIDEVIQQGGSIYSEIQQDILE